MTATREELEAVIRDQLGRVVANALTTGVPSRGMFNRAIEAITKAAGLDGEE